MPPALRQARIAGAQVEPLGEMWAAYSPLTGETSLLNDESAAILEILDSGPARPEDVVATLAADSGLSPTELEPLLDAAWITLRGAGLVGPVAEPATIAG